MQQRDLIPDLFRTEYSKIVSVLCKRFGMEHIELAEDIAGETFLLAVESWPYQGLPENPVAWLYAVAKNKAKNHFTRERIFTEKIAPHLGAFSQEPTEYEIDLSEKNSTDSQLQMLFAICHPVISAEAQIALALKILCGFGIDEIADAFMTSKETINKRLFRAKEKLREEKIQLVFPDSPEVEKRLNAVLTTLYLLFSEGYYSERKRGAIRRTFCHEAMRLTYLLVAQDQTDQHDTHALFALMCFHASRLDARQNENGELILYNDQDENLWDHELIERGNFHLQKSAQWKVLSKFGLEARIAWWHTVKTDSAEKWEHILQLYNHLLQLEYSPIAALNRTYALSRANGKSAAIIEAEKLQLTTNHFYYVLLGELYTDIDNNKARLQFQKAFSLAKTETDKKTIQKKMDTFNS